jgi:hypothetical protein
MGAGVEGKKVGVLARVLELTEICSRLHQELASING